TMQVFQRSDAMVACGIDEALSVLALGAGSFVDAAAADRAFAAYLTARDAARRARPKGGDAWVEAVRAQVEAEGAFDRHWRPAAPGQLQGGALRDGGRGGARGAGGEGTRPFRAFAPPGGGRGAGASRVFFSPPPSAPGAPGGGAGSAALGGGAEGVATDAQAAWW